jgi:hypothetical protein
LQQGWIIFQAEADRPPMGKGVIGLKILMSLFPEMLISFDQVVHS